MAANKAFVAQLDVFDLGSINLRGMLWLSCSFSQEQTTWQRLSNHKPSPSKLVVAGEL